MLIETSIAFAIGVVVANEAGRRVQRRRHGRRREQLLVQAMQKAAGDPLVSRKPQLSERRSEMELLLVELESAGETLAQALTAETDFGQQHETGSLEPSLCLAQWHEARRTVESAQGVYSQRADAYSQFVHSLAPPLRAGATERGNRIMVFDGALLPVAIG